MKDYKAIYEEWLSNPYFDQETKEELRAIRADEKEIKERFYMDLEFGTAGLRGVIGAGINRMNIYTVRRATQGLADYILEQGGAERGVAIAYDSRRMSPEFSDEAARTLAANGIKAYRFESLRPTPELSFAVRELGCIAGINITASHNPPEYNGYKVYWEDGAQFTPPHDKGVTEKVMAITDLSAVRTMSREEAEASGLYVTTQCRNFVHGILHTVIFIRIFQCRTNEQSVFSHALSCHRFCNGFHIESIVHFTAQRNRHLFCCFNINCFAAKCLFDGFCSTIASLS